MFFMNSVKGRLTAMFVAIGVLATLTVGVYFIFSTIQENKEENIAYRKNLEEHYDREIKLQTEALVSSLNGIYSQQQQGKITEAQGKELALATIRALRYDDGKGYFFADEKATGICVAHATLGSKVEGKMRLNDKDSNGVLYMQEIFKAAQQEGGGYSNFAFPKPGESTDLPKRGYSMEFKPYGWIICTGSWIDYIDEAAAAYVAENESAIQTTIVAQRLSQWPYEKSKLTYVLVNKDIVNISQDVSLWKNIVEDAITEKLASKGLTKVASNGALTVQYGVMVKSDDKKNADLMFDSIGLTTGSTSHGVDNSIDITIKDNRSGRELWSGAVSALTDKPLKTEAQKRRAVNSIVGDLVRKLPVAN